MGSLTVRNKGVAVLDFDAIYAQVPDAQKQLLHEFRANHPYSELDVAGTLWRYIACGQGERALLFLPGGFLKADMWFHPILELEKDHRIVAPDSFTLQGVFAMDDVCSAIARVLDAERVERITIVGISAGGGVAQLFLQEYPERVEHLVLSHCGVIEGGGEAEDRVKRILWLVKIVPLFITRRILLMMRTTGNVPHTSEWVVFHNAYFREANAHIKKEMFVRFLQGSRETRRHFVHKPEVLEAWPGEVLILSSKDDEVTLRSLDELQARYPRAKTHLFEQGGHHTFLFFPKEYTAVLTRFLQKALCRLC
jgi:pimeloyl-ACP methyl ester carboxylesterase